MTADQEPQSRPRWLGLRHGQSYGLTELLLGLLCLLLTAIIFQITSSTHPSLPHVRPLGHADLTPIPQPLVLKGSLLADSQHGQITALHWVVALAPMASPLDLTAPHLALRYQDATQQLGNLAWSWRFQSGSNDNSLLEEGEQVELIVPLTTVLTSPLGANTPFRVELAAPQRLLFSLQRTTPSVLDTQVDLN